MLFHQLFNYLCDSGLICGTDDGNTNGGFYGGLLRNEMMVTFCQYSVTPQSV